MIPMLLLVGGSLGLDLLMVIPSIETASSLEGAITPGFSSPPVSFWVWSGPGFEPQPSLQGKLERMHCISSDLFAARPMALGRK